MYANNGHGLKHSPFEYQLNKLNYKKNPKKLIMHF